MSKNQTTRRQKDIARLMREKSDLFKDRLKAHEKARPGKRHK